MSDKKYFLVGGSESSYNADLSDVLESFVARIQSYLPSNPVEFVGLSQVRKGLAQGLQKAKSAIPDAAVVTLSKLYFPDAEFDISANRLIDVNRQSIGLGNRPYSPDLTEQVRRVMSAVGERPVITVDDTLFHGDTIQLLIDIGLRVNAMVEYFTSLPTMQEFEKRGISVFSVIGLDDYLDVMPVHDFLPPTPLCGKVVGFRDELGSHPLMTDDGKRSFSVPYLLPWITPQEIESWASIPEDRAFDFSSFAIERSIEVAQRLWKFGFTTLDDATTHSSLRVSYPYLKGKVPGGNVSITAMLERYLHLLQSGDWEKV